jgi:ribonucleoside-diphosphate reductase beta chain
MNAGLMTQYLEFVADRLLVELGCDRNTKLLILWISLQGKPISLRKK